MKIFPLQIPVKADLPVGKNLQDHLWTDAVVYTFDQPVTIVAQRLGIKDKLEFQLFGTGIYLP